jgi:hypothetical protein
MIPKIHNWPESGYGQVQVEFKPAALVDGTCEPKVTRLCAAGGTSPFDILVFQMLIPGMKLASLLGPAFRSPYIPWKGIQTMTETSPTQSPPANPPEDFHWGIAYLREDMQDMKRDMRELRQEMRQEISGLRQEMHQGIGDLRQEMRQEIGGLRQEMRQEIGSLHGRIDGVNTSLSQRIDSRFAWVITTMVALAAIIIAAIKIQF